MHSSDSNDSESVNRKQQNLGRALTALIIGRRWRTLLLMAPIILLVAAFLWKIFPEVGPLPHHSAYRYHDPSWWLHDAFKKPSEVTDAELLQHPNVTINLGHNDNEPDASGLQKRNVGFHLLIPASETNPNLCKTLLSALVLNYPPPTLINFNKTFDEGNWDKGSHTGKIRGVFDFLQDRKHVQDEDFVLVIDGYDIWFQLPPDVMIRRYQQLTNEANARLWKKYGPEMPTENVVGLTSKFTQSVIWAADKICWPNPAGDPACASVPDSTLPKDVYSDDTDQDPHAFHNRPKYLNSGTVIGPASALRLIYETATRKVDMEGRGIIGDQFVFAEIFGEQEYAREANRRASRGPGAQFWEWLGAKLSWPHQLGIATANMTIVPGRNHEFGIGLDYASSMFQVMTHSDKDIEFLCFNDSDALGHILKPYQTGPLGLTSDILPSGDPFSLYSSKATEGGPANILPFNPNLDILPDNLSWQNVSLATNIRARSIPALFHFNGPEKSHLGPWWSRMWYQPYARALLRAAIRPAEPTASDQWSDMRGGKGGVWTDSGQWLNWTDICGGYEQEVFGDGKGRWGREKGEDYRIWNEFGILISGEEWVEEGTDS